MLHSLCEMLGLLDSVENALDQRHAETDQQNLDRRQRETDHQSLEQRGSHPEDSLTHNLICGKVILVRGVVWIKQGYDSHIPSHHFTSRQLITQSIIQASNLLYNVKRQKCPVIDQLGSSISQCCGITYDILLTLYVLLLSLRPEDRGPGQVF